MSVSIYPGKQRMLLALLILFCVSTWLQAEPVVTIRNNGDSANRVDIVLLSEGYTAGELSQWAIDAEAGIVDLFLNEPFNEYQKYFNVHRIDVASMESGADHPETGVYKNTAFDATYNCSGVQSLICISNSKVATVLGNSIQPNQMDIVIVVVNDLEYGGSGGQYAVASLHTDSQEIILHELGHSFGLLADEYTSSPPPCNNTVEPPEPNVTMQTSRNLIKWNQGGGPPAGWIEFSTPIPTVTAIPSGAGLYQGAKYCASGLYRPTSNSKMNTLYAPFGPINEEQLVKRFYNFVSPIDSSMPVAPSLVLQQGSSSVFQVTVPMPMSMPLDVTWYVNGLVSGSGLAFTLDTSALAIGFHTVKAEARDTTAKVRYDPASVLMDSRLWSVEITSGDGDGDGVPDSQDNCINEANTPQRDTDNDGYGNRCDPDFNNDNMVNGADLAYFKTKFFSNDPDADLNGDGIVNGGDLAIFKLFFFKPPGPSGLN